jgi:hypothetical protein
LLLRVSRLEPYAKYENSFFWALSNVVYTSIEFPSGDWILLYTDGIREMNEADEQFGEARLKHLPGKCSPSAADFAAPVALSDWSSPAERR